MYSDFDSYLIILLNWFLFNNLNLNNPNLIFIFFIINIFYTKLYSIIKPYDISQYQRYKMKLKKILYQNDISTNFPLPNNSQKDFDSVIVS